jgi:S1-C subfamily serine protease
MRNKLLYALLLIPILTGGGTTVADRMTEEDQTIAAADHVLAATVKIDRKHGLDGTGTGFYIAADRILTNEHVIRGYSDVNITFADGRECTARVGYRSESDDIAILTPDCDNGIYLAIADTYRVGQGVVVVGNPSNFPFTTTKGVVSSDRGRWMQIDAKVNNGSSGSAVVNLNGEVIGMVTAKAKTSEYIGLAVPVERIEKFLEWAKEGYRETMAEDSGDRTVPY